MSRENSGLTQSYSFSIARVVYSSAHLHYGPYPLLEADESVASNTAGDGLVEPVSLAKALYAVSSDRWFSRRRRHRT